MTKSKASLKGRGVDILLGGSAQSEPEPAADAPAESAAAQPNPFAESAASEPAAELPNPFAEPSPRAASPDVAPALEEALLSEAVGGQPAEPVVTSLPPEDTPWLADEPPPIPETPAFDSVSSAGPVSVPLPDDPTLLKTPKIGGWFMSLPSIPNPESFEPETELTQTGLKVGSVSRAKPTESYEVVIGRIGQDRIDALSKRIDKLYEQVTSGIISDPSQAGDALLYLRRARDKELEDQRQFDEAEYLVNVAQYIVTHAGNVRTWSYTYGIALLVYGLIWLGVFVAGLIFDQALLNWFRTFLTVPATATRMADIFGPYDTVVWGGIGGVLGLLYSLFKHIAVRQDFDRQYTIWYIVQPFMGMLMGAIVHLFFVAGIFQLVGATAEAFRALGALLAIAAAFRQHYVYAWLEAVLKNFQPGGAGAEAEAGAKPVGGSEVAPPPETSGVG
jgi:hypothetical protein